MNSMNVELKSHLNPTALRILKKRLVSGKITPQVFKDILKQQMIRYFFQTYRHPLIKTWENYWRFTKKQGRENQLTVQRPRGDNSETYHHKHF